MDPFTHAVIGATIGYALCGQKLGKHAAALGALSAISPDVDHFVSSKSDPLLYIEYHRFFTHSLLFAFVGAFVPMLPWIARARFRAQWGTLWLCSWPAYLSHCLLDASTTWGTRLYWPFAQTRVSWDLIAIVDPLFTFTLTSVLAFALVRKSRGVVVAGFAFALAYLALGGVQHYRAMHAQTQLAARRGHSIERTQVMPTLANNIVWRSVYLANGKIYSDRIRAGWFSGVTVREGLSLPLLTAKDLRGEEQEGNRVHHGFDRFAWFTGGWTARAPIDDTVIGDMRYSRSTDAFDPVWGIRLTHVNGRYAVEWVSRERERDLGVHQLWDEIVGNDDRYK
jgi:inner membrane protein